MESPLAAHRSTPTELRDRLDAEASGDPFVVYRDEQDVQVLLALGGLDRVTIGRREESDIPLPWDGRVSRLHAELQRVGGEWVVVDDGLSTNGTWIGERRLSGRSRLEHGDLVRCGGTVIAFCAPHDSDAGTSLADDVAEAVRISPAQRRVLVALCRPSLEGQGLAAPPTNQQLADELFLSVDSVKTHLRMLMEAFNLGDVAQGQKRATLIERAIRLGMVTERDLAA